jgi:hypothetical protein
MRRKPKRKSTCASALYVKTGFSPELNQLVSQRVTRGQCVECGGRPVERDSLCASCQCAYPKVTNIAEPGDAWQWRVRQARPVYLGSVFWAERIGVYEREGRTKFIGLFDSFDEAKQAAEKNRERSLSAAMEVSW